MCIVGELNGESLPIVFDWGQWSFWETLFVAVQHKREKSIHSGINSLYFWETMAQSTARVWLLWWVSNTLLVHTMVHAIVKIYCCSVLFWTMTIVEKYIIVSMPVFEETIQYKTIRSIHSQTMALGECYQISGKRQVSLRKNRKRVCFTALCRACPLWWV